MNAMTKLALIEEERLFEGKPALKSWLARRLEKSCESLTVAEVRAEVKKCSRQS